MSLSIKHIQEKFNDYCDHTFARPWAYYLYDTELFLEEFGILKEGRLWDIMQANIYGIKEEDNNYFVLNDNYDIHIKDPADIKSFLRDNYEEFYQTLGK